MEILITGATGYIGNQLIQRLSKMPFQIRCLARNPDRMKEIKNTSIKVRRGDLLSHNSLREIMKGIEYQYNILKFFHSEKNGGISSLKFFNEIFQDISFIPTGGVNINNCDLYLKENNVLAVGSTSF